MKRKKHTEANTGRRAKRPSAMITGLLFILGVHTMVVELTVPRLIAPTFGNTLFSWTAIIAVVLSALAVGYYFGGWLATRPGVPRVITSFAAGSAAWVCAVAVVGDGFITRLDALGLIAGPLVASMLLAALPALLNAAVVPLIVSLRHETAGEAAGHAFFWSTLGSIAGVLVTGYVLLPRLGITGTLLTGSGLVFITLLLNRKRATGGLGLVLVASLATLSTPARDGALLDSSNGYHRIRVVEQPTGVRTLYLDSTREGGVILGRTEPLLNYQRQLARIVPAVEELQRACFIGGGAFSMPKFLHRIAPGTEIEVVELDPEVVDVAARYLELEPVFTIRIGDGRQVLRDMPAQHCDLIINDAFRGVRSIPFHLVTREFAELAAGRLTPDGVYAVNVVGDPANSPLVQAMISTLATSFDYLGLLPLQPAGATNLWILASHRPVRLGTTPSEAQLRGRVFTDNHAPVEYLVLGELLRGR